MRPSFRIWRRLLAILLLWPGVLRAQLPGEGVISARSVSGQFIVQGRQATSLPVALLNLSTNRDFVFMETTLLTVSTERVKGMISRELGSTGEWKGRIYLELVPRRSPFDGAEVVASRFADGWQYRLQLPSIIDRTRYLRSLVQVILLEVANRQNTGEHLAEVPPWLVEGLTRHLTASGELELVFPPPELKQSGRPPATFIIANKQNPLLPAHEMLVKAGAGVTFEDLCWGPANSGDPHDDELYRNSAQVFYWRLARLPEGRACLRGMLESLPHYYNWQLAFLGAFRGYFERPLDVEKWWALQVVQFTGRELGQTWPREQSLAKLEEALRVSVRVYDRANSLPGRSAVSLQDAAANLQLADQIKMLTEKLRQLALLEQRVAPELVYLAAAYQSVVYDYLQHQPKERKGRAMTTSKKGLSRSARIFREKLDTLDERLAQEKLSLSKTPIRDPGAKVAAKLD